MMGASRRRATRLIAATTLVCLLCVHSTFGAFRAGIAVRDVTPKKLLPVSGGVGASEPVTQRIGSLTVRALVMEQDGTRVAICSTDFLGFPSVLSEKVFAQVPGIPGENILIGATHNHSGPDCYGFPDETGKTACNLTYLDAVCAKLAAAINEAVRNLQPANIKIATGQARGKIAYNYYAEQLYDPRCHVLQCLGADGKPIATLVNYACHPEVIGADQGIMCPDFVGPLYDRIEAKGGGTGIFMNSALGGMVTADCRGPAGRDVQTWDECVRIGSLLGDEALRIVSAAAVQREPELTVRNAIVTFPVESRILRAVVEMSPLGYKLGENGTISTRLNVVNLGNAQMLTIPGEAMPNIGYYLKRNMAGEHNFLLGLTNDAFGYILARVDFDSFERYEYITRTCLGENTGEIFMEAALKLANSSASP